MLEAKYQKDGEVYWTEFDFLENFMVEAFQKIGVPEEDAKTCADSLIHNALALFSSDPV